ncbi:MAG: hypothetical protein HY904_22815 [Deltaproteobacteria bacterium]|nr:hypothetical protein [Deltaproteobacteria bacterium]
MNQSLTESSPKLRVRIGDEVLYVGKNSTCCLVRDDGSQLGIELRGGVPVLTASAVGFAEGPWSRKMTVSIASSLALQAGLQGTVAHVEGSISTIHRVRITG